MITLIYQMFFKYVFQGFQLISWCRCWLLFLSIFSMVQLTLRRVMDTAKQVTKSGNLNEFSMVLLNNTLSLPLGLLLIYVFNEVDYLYSTWVCFSLHLHNYKGNCFLTRFGKMGGSCWLGQTRFLFGLTWNTLSYYLKMIYFNNYHYYFTRKTQV